MRFPLFTLLLLAACLPAWAQAPVDITSEPHHHLIFSNDQVRVFAVDLRGGERAFVRHEQNFLIISLQDGEIIMWPEGAADIQNYPTRLGEVHFFVGGHAIGLRNNTNHEYRNVTVEFFDPKVTNYAYQYGEGRWDYGTNSIALPADPHAKYMNAIALGAASAYEVQLLAGDTLAPPAKDASELFIAVTDIDLKASDTERIRKPAGDVTWIPAGRKSTFFNASGGIARGSSWSNSSQQVNDTQHFQSVDPPQTHNHEPPSSFSGDACRRLGLAWELSAACPGQPTHLSYSRSPSRNHPPGRRYLRD